MVKLDGWCTYFTYQQMYLLQNHSIISLSIDLLIKIGEFVKFVCFECSSMVEAISRKVGSSQWSSIVQIFVAINHEIGEAAAAAEETVLHFSSNCSPKLDEDVKSWLASKLFTIERPQPEVWLNQKLKFPLLTPTKLNDLIGPKSWFIFHLLNITAEWLKTYQQNWERIWDL